MDKMATSIPQTDKDVYDGRVVIHSMQAYAETMHNILGTTVLNADMELWEGSHE